MTSRPLVAGRRPAGLPAGVEFSETGDRLVLRADRALTGLATGIFAHPAVYVDLDLAEPGAALLGWSYGQFAWPVRSVGRTPFELNPTPNVHSPPVVLPLLVRSDRGEVELLAPLDGWYEQVIAVEQAGALTGLRWGWHGDLDEVPAGFSTTLGRFRGTSAREVLNRWGRLVQDEAGTRRPPPDADPVVTHLSYWTDNGAAYWYRTEPGLDMEATLARKVAELAELGTPVRSVELDSWFYPHETSRSVTSAPPDRDVPPTGMLVWEPRPDVLPGGIEQLRDRLGAAPLVLHARHISPRSPYLAEGEWWTELSSIPADPAFFDRWCADAARWGATCIEQDWLPLFWYGARQLRSRPGRALALLSGLNRAAARHGLSLVLCMALPGDLLATTALDRVVAVRTSDDYRIADDPAYLWVWYLTGNLLADALGLASFKDCFLSAADPGDDRLDGDPHAEVEALLAVMSAGVVGIGDRIGRTDPALLARLCRPDGTLVKPDRPITLHESRVFSAGQVNGEICWAETVSGRWRYVVALHTAPTEAPQRDELVLGDEYLVYDWRRQEAAPASRIEVELAHREWGLWVCCPLWDGSDGRHALVGDPTRYATMGGQRVRYHHGVASLLLAAQEETGIMRRWSEDRGLFDHQLSRSDTVHIPATTTGSGITPSTPARRR